MTPQVTAVVLAYGDEPVLGECVQAILASTGVDVDVVLVDNGCTTDAVDRLRESTGVTVVSPEDQHRFRGRLQPRCPPRPRGGARLRQRRRRGPARRAASPGRRPRRRRGRPGERVAAALRPARGDELRRQPDALLGPELGGGARRAGHGVRRPARRGLGDRRSHGGPRRPVRRARRVRRGDVRLLRGRRAEPAHLAARLDGALRAGRRGAAPLRVLPEPAEELLLERNRLFLVGTLYERGTLAVLLPVLLAPGGSGRAGRTAPGLVPPKGGRLVVAVSEPRLVAARRREVQASRRVPDRDLAALLTGDFDPGESTGLAAPGASCAPLRAATGRLPGASSALAATRDFPRAPLRRRSQQPR